MERSLNRIWTWTLPVFMAGALVWALAMPWQVALASDADAGKSMQSSAGTKPAPDRAKLSKGWGLVRVSDWAAAIATFEQLAQGASDGQVRAQAVYALGSIWQHRGSGADRDKAAEYYGEVLDRYSDTKMAPWAALALARMAAVPAQEPQEEHDRRKLGDQPQRSNHGVVAGDGHPPGDRPPR